MRRPPRSPLFPPPTLFRSRVSLANPAAQRTQRGRPAAAGRVHPALRQHVPGAARPVVGGSDTASRVLHLDGRQDRKSTRSELQSHLNLVCRLLLEKKNK